MRAGRSLAEMLAVPLDPSLRRNEADQVQDAFDAVVATGEGRIVLVTAPPGSGKSTFLAQVTASLTKDETRPSVVAARFTGDGELSGWALPPGRVDVETILTGLGQVISTSAAAGALADAAGAAGLGV